MSSHSSALASTANPSYLPLAEPLSTFTSFKKLPAELRCKIWNGALHTEHSKPLRVILIDIFLTTSDNPKQNGHIIKRTNEGTRQYPLTSRSHFSIYNTCAESRHEFEKLFPETLDLTSRHEDEGPKLRYDESRNLFLLRNASRLVSIARSSMRLVDVLAHDALANTGLTQIRHLAFSLENMSQGFEMITKLTNASVKFNLMFPNLRQVIFTLSKHTHYWPVQGVLDLNDYGPRCLDELAFKDAFHPKFVVISCTGKILGQGDVGKRLVLD